MSGIRYQVGSWRVVWKENNTYLVSNIDLSNERIKEIVDESNNACQPKNGRRFIFFADSKEELENRPPLGAFL